MMPVPAYWYVVCCQSCQCAVPFPWYGFFYADIGHLFLFYYYQLEHWSIFHFSDNVSSYGTGSESTYLLCKTGFL